MKCKHQIEVNGITICEQHAILSLPSKYSRCPKPWYCRLWNWIKRVKR